MASIVIDTGNTSTSIGRWEDGHVSCITALNGGIKDPVAVEQALIAAGAATADSAILASVVPALNPTWSWMMRRVFGIELEILSCRTPLPIGIDYPQPCQIGADRLADAAGAVARHGAPVMVADFGTALTFDVVDKAGNYIGGVIAPGLPLMTGYLHEKTAQLPRVDLGGDMPVRGDSTENAMKLGAKLGHRGMVREIADYIRQFTGTDTVLCATGGYAAWALEGLGIPCSIEPDLTLFGLGTIHDYGRRSGASRGKGQ